MIFGGDFLSGPEQDEKVLEKIAKLIKQLKKPFYYIFGNRDFELVYKDTGVFRSSDEWYELDKIGEKQYYTELLDGYCLDEKDYNVENYIFTNKIENLNENKILITHSIKNNFRSEQTKSLLYLYGHDHIARIYKNYIDLGSIYRDTFHGSEPLLGGYFFITLNKYEFDIEFCNFGNLKPTKCLKHNDQGIFFIPKYWKKECPLCYENGFEKHHFNF